MNSLRVGNSLVAQSWRVLDKTSGTCFPSLSKIMWGFDCYNQFLAMLEKIWFSCCWLFWWMQWSIWQRTRSVQQTFLLFQNFRIVQDLMTSCRGCLSKREFEAFWWGCEGTPASKFLNSLVNCVFCRDC